MRTEWEWGVQDDDLESVWTFTGAYSHGLMLAADAAKDLARKHPGQGFTVTLDGTTFVDRPNGWTGRAYVFGQSWSW